MSIWCKHYRGMGMYETCKVGCHYQDVRIPGNGGGLNFPCLKPELADHCPLHALATAEEEQSEIAEMYAYTQRAEAAKKAVIAHRSATGESAGMITCPNCDGAMKFRIAPNDHAAVKCSTPGCLHFIE
jgi:hypothetical protein